MRRASKQRALGLVPHDALEKRLHVFTRLLRSPEQPIDNVLLVLDRLRVEPAPFNCFDHAAPNLSLARISRPPDRDCCRRFPRCERALGTEIVAPVCAHRVSVAILVRHRLRERHKHAFRD